MKIVLVHNSYQVRGGEDVVFEQEMQLLRQAGHDVLTYLRSNSELQDLSGVRLLQLAPRTIWARDTRKEFAKLLDREKPDLVHVHNTLVMISPSIFFACREAWVPVVQTLHNYRLYCPGATLFRDGHPCEECIDHSLWRGIAHGCYRNSRVATASVALMLAVHRQRQTWTRDVSCYIALSQFARSKFLKAGLPAQKVFVKPNFVDPDPGMRANGEGDYALFVGRLSSERLRTLLGAWSLLPMPRIPLIIIGGGTQLAGFEKEASQRGLAEVRFKGQLPREATLQAMRGARFLVFSSEWYENFPVTIAEAFACGVPVICSRLGAMQEIVEDGRTGFHFSPGDAVDLAEKTQWAWDHPACMRDLGKEARREYEAKYTAAKNYPIMMRIYRHAIGQVDFKPSSP
jgi:glycosyltransferase involved in cell wall biosynthesis